MLIDDENDLVELAILGIEPAIMPIQATRDVVEFSVVSGDGARNLGQQLVDRRDIDAVPPLIGSARPCSSATVTGRSPNNTAVRTNHQGLAP